MKFLCSVLAAKNLGETAYNNFVDHTYLADRKTTIRDYLATTGSGIMEEQPPESLKHRYGGWFPTDDFYCYEYVYDYVKWWQMG